MAKLLNITVPWCDMVKKLSKNDIENCKYSLRDHMKSLEDFYVFFDNCKFLDYYRKIIIRGKLQRKINNIKEYLDIPYTEPKKVSFGGIFDNLKEHLKGE